MSRIIRNVHAKQAEEKEIKIQPFSFFQPQSIDGYEQIEQEPTLTYEQILAERDQLLADAQQQIAVEREQLAQEKQDQLDAIDQLKQLWEEEKPMLQQQAYDEAFATGYEEGIQKATADMERAIAEANETIALAKVNAEAYIASQEDVILELAMQSAERILNIELNRNDEAFLAVIKRGLKEAREMKEIKIYVAPEYYELISRNYDELKELFPVDVPFMIFVNEDLTNSECYIETNHGRIVVSIDVQLNELRLNLREILESKD